MSRRTSFVFLPLLLSSVAAATGGCAPSATLIYRQLGACDDFTPATLQAGPNKAYVFFRMDALDNTLSSVNVAFDPFQLRVPNLTNVPGEGTIDKALTNLWAQALQGPPTGPITVPAFTNQSLSGWGVMLVSTSTSDGAVEANMTPYFLVDAPGSNILANKEASSQTTWPYTRDCGEINFTAQGG